VLHQPVGPSITALDLRGCSSPTPPDRARPRPTGRRCPAAPGQRWHRPRAAAPGRRRAEGLRPPRERGTDRGGLLLQHGRPGPLARHHDRERHLHHPSRGRPADAPDDLGIGRGPQGFAGTGEGGTGIVVESGCDRRRRLGPWQARPQILPADAHRELSEEDLQAVALGRGADLLEVGEAHPGTEQHREPFDQGSLHAFGATSILVDRGGEEHGEEVDIGAPRDSVAAGDAAVEIGAVQLRSELPGQHIRRRGGHALVLGLQVRQVGLRADVALGVETVEVHQVIVAVPAMPRSAAGEREAGSRAVTRAWGGAGEGKSNPHRELGKLCRAGRRPALPQVRLGGVCRSALAAVVAEAWWGRCVWTARGWCAVQVVEAGSPRSRVRALPAAAPTTPRGSAHTARNTRGHQTASPRLTPTPSPPARSRTVP
jgi:hypothetical protein